MLNFMTCTEWYKIRYHASVVGHALIITACLFPMTIAIAVPEGYLEYVIPLNASPTGLAFDTGGVLYALEAATFQNNTTTIRVIQSDNTFGTDITVTGDDPENLFVGGMTYDPLSDRLLITDNTADGRLYSVSKTGFQQTIATGLAAISGVAVRSTGEIFVSTALGGNAGEVLQIDRATGKATSVATGLDFGGGLAFDASGDLLVIEADEATFQGRLHQFPITDGALGLEFGTQTLLASSLQPGFSLVLDDEGDLFATGSGGLFSVTGSPLNALSFDNNGEPFPFATAVAFDAGALPFEPFAGADAGRLAYSSNFSDAFVTLIRPTPPVAADFNEDDVIDAADLRSWHMQFGSVTTANRAQGDSDGDYDVDGNDFLNWQRQFDSGIADSQLQIVPEPTSGGLFCWFAALLAGTSIRQCLSKTNQGLVGVVDY